MDFRHLIVTCLFSKLRLPFDNQKVKENYAIFLTKQIVIAMGEGAKAALAAFEDRMRGTIY